MTQLIPMQPEVVDVRVDTLVIADEISFNEWRRYGEQLLATEGSLQWYLGDWWAFGQKRFGMDYQPALDVLVQSHVTLLEYARVARAFPPRRLGEDAHRISEISWTHHRDLAAIKDPQERMAWLEDSIRQNWSSRQLKQALADHYGSERAPVVALNVRLLDEHYRIAIESAERREMDPRDWVLEAIREKRDREQLEEAA